MHDLQSASGGAYLHALQPNQYHGTERVFAAEEAAVAFSKQSRYGPLASSGYPPLIQEAVGLREAGVAVHDLTTIFDDLEEPAYADDCCHYTDLGQRVVLEMLADLAAPLLTP